MKGAIYKTKYGYQVRFGRKITKRFKSIKDAEWFLNGIRYETDRGTFDKRDYQRDNPLGFRTLANKWISFKERTDIKKESLAPLRNYMGQAIDVWGDGNIKTIGSGEIEDFLWLRNDISSKTRSNMRSCLNQFWRWVVRREKIEMPEIPNIPFELGWRNIIDIDTQQSIINEVRKISYNVNPKIWIGIKWLSTYISIRPGELINIKESQIDTRLGALVIPHPKEKKPKVVYLMEEDIEIIRSMPRGLPDLLYFRHPKGTSGIAPGARFGVHYLWKWWKRACANLNIHGIDLYGGLRHSTVTALGRICTPEEVKDATGHTSKAFERYFQDKQARALAVTKKIKGLSGTDTPVINIQERIKNVK